MKKKKGKCQLCGKYQARYTDLYRICDACGSREKKIGRGNHRQIDTQVMKKRQASGRKKSLARKRGAFNPVIESLLRVG